MPYATTGGVSRANKSADPAWIEITDEQYDEALAGMLSGKVVTIAGGFAIVAPPLPLDDIPPPPIDMSLDAVKSRQHVIITNGFSSAAQNLVTGYPEAERLTWPTQQSEALAWEADNSAPTPYLDSIATARGIDVQQMRSITVAQVHTFQTASAQLVGTRQKLRDAIDAVTDTTPNAVAAVQAIVWPA